MYSIALQEIHGVEFHYIDVITLVKDANDFRPYKNSAPVSLRRCF